MAAQSRPLAGHVFDSASLPEAVDRVLHWFQRHLVTASVLFRRRPGRMGSWRRVSAALVVALVVTLLLKPPAYAADDGSLDAAFTTANGTGANSDMRPIAVQADQKSVIGGNFTDWNGTTAGRVVRLNTDGSLDTAFTTNTGTGASGSVWSIAVQADQKLVIGGFFATWNGATVERLVRLNTDGTHDTAFTTNTGAGANGSVWSVAVQADQKIVIGGDFTTWNGAAAGGVVRLNANGTQDTAFTINTGTGANGSVHFVALQADQQIILGGDFTVWGPTAVGRVVRLSTGGTMDTAFTTNIGTGANAIVYSVVVQADQKIIIGGGLTSWGGTTVGRSVRLNSNGTSDTAFTTTTGTGANGTVWSAAVQADQRILVVGDFTSWNGAIVTRVVRLNTGGDLDTAFTTSTGTGANGSVRSLAVQTNQQSLIGGAFTTWNIAAVGRVVRLNGTAATGSQSQVVALRAPVIQQFGRPLTGTCDEAALESLNWWGVASGGWAQSWAAWVNDGRGGAVCTRTFRYSTVQSQWIVDEP